MWSNRALNVSIDILYADSPQTSKVVEGTVYVTHLTIIFIGLISIIFFQLSFVFFDFSVEQKTLSCYNGCKH